MTEFVNQMILQVSGTPADWGLSAGDISSLTALAGSWSDGYTAALTAEAARKASVASKDTAKGLLIKKLQQVNKKVQATPTVTSAMKHDAGFPVYDTDPSPIVAQEVEELMVSPFANGNNKLKWSRSGNNKTVKFRVEASYDNRVTWSQITTLTATRFTHPGQTPGVEVWYRVTAYSKSNTAPSSPWIAAYSNGEESSLKIAA